MEKQPLTPAGLTAKTTALYALSDKNLLTQANLVADDYLSWMQDNFLLSDAEELYIETAPTYVRKLWGYLYAATFLTKGPITMIAIPDNPEPRRTKELRHNMSAILSYNNFGKKSSGEIEIEMDWQLL